MTTELVKQKVVRGEMEHNIRLYRYKSVHRGFKSQTYEVWDLIVDNGQVFKITHKDKFEAAKAFDLLDIKAMLEIERLEKLKGENQRENAFLGTVGSYKTLSGGEQPDSEN